MILYLTEEEIKKILNMKDALQSVEMLFSEQGKSSDIINHPRNRLKTGSSMLHYMAAALPYLGYMGYKAYSSTKDGFSFKVFLYDIETGRLLSIMEADRMGMIRTGAVTGVATKYMSHKSSGSVGIIGAGFQAEGQILAICEVRDIKKIKVFCRDEERRRKFAKKMEKLIDAEVIAVNSAGDAVRDVDILVTCTTSRNPVFDFKDLTAGVHINAIGGNFLFKSEIDEKTVVKSSVVVVEDIDQARLEAGELLSAIDKGKLYWNQLTELKNVVSGNINILNNGKEITLFKSLGVAMEDIAVAADIYKMAKKKNLGKYIDSGN